METATVPTGVSNAEKVRWAFELINRHDVAPLKQFWTEDTVERFPDQTCHGADEIAAYFERVFVAIPDLQIEVKGIADDGVENVFVRWQLTGTHQGALMGIAPTGKQLAIDGIDHFVIRDEKVVSNFVVSDQLQYARQIGMMPEDGSGADRALKGLFSARTNLARKLRGRG